MNPSDWIAIDQQEKTINVVLPEGWRVSILTADSGLDLSGSPAPSIPPGTVMLMIVKAKRVAPAPTFGEASA